MQDFKTIRNIANSHGEYNDCVVIAFALACELPYEEVHAIFKRAGRKDRAGTWSHELYAGMAILEKEYGFRFEKIVHKYTYPDGKQGLYTMKTIGAEFPEGKFVMQCSGHMAALIEGEVQDWTQGRMHRVKWLHRVIKPSQK